MRKAWMDWVAKTRKKGNRGKDKNMTHREALKAAAITWPKEKLKLVRRQKRVCKKKVAVKLPEETPDVLGDENGQA